MVKIFALVLGGRESTGTLQSSEYGEERPTGLWYSRWVKASKSFTYHSVLMVDRKNLPFLRVSMAFQAEHCKPLSSP